MDNMSQNMCNVHILVCTVRRKNMNMFKHIYMYTRKHIFIRKNTCMHERIYRHIVNQTDSLSYSYTYAQTNIKKHAHKHTNISVCTYMNTQTHKHTITKICTHTH